MNTASVITASVFSVLSIAVLIYLFAGKSEFAKGKYKGFYRACCGVFVSGTILVLVFTLIMKGLPVTFVLISDITISFVFAFTAGLIYFMTKKIVEASSMPQKTTDDEPDKE